MKVIVQVVALRKPCRLYTHDGMAAVPDGGILFTVSEGIEATVFASEYDAEAAIARTIAHDQARDRPFGFTRETWQVLELPG